jgi:hypothetical protein
MLRPECTHFLCGPPLISVEALCELHDLLTAWQTAATCGKALLKSPAKEGGDETISEATQGPDESAPSQCASEPSLQQQAKGTGAYAHGATHQRDQRKQSPGAS